MTEKDNNRIIGFILGGVIVIPLFIWVAYSNNNIKQGHKGIYLYNPHPSKMKIEIGDFNYVLRPFEKKITKLSKGQYFVKSYLNDTIIFDTTIHLSSSIMNEGGLINLSGESLYLWTERYGSPEIENIYSLNDSISNSFSPYNQIKSQNQKIIQIDSTIMYGNIKEYNDKQIILKKEWYFDIDQPFKKEISTYSHTNLVLGEDIPKLFDKKGILKYWQKKQIELIQND